MWLKRVISSLFAKPEPVLYLPPGGGSATAPVTVVEAPAVLSEIPKADVPRSLPACQVVAGECKVVSRTLADLQNRPSVTVMAPNVTRIVNALVNAANLLGALDKFEITGGPPPGWVRTESYTEDGRLVVTFTQCLSQPVKTPPTVEGYNRLA